MKPELLRMLIIEDDEADAELIRRKLCQLAGHCDCRLVVCRAELEEALAADTWDLVVTDHRLPDLDAFTVMAMAGRAQPLLPVILVSGAIGEEEVARAMHAGVKHFVRKDNLDRLPQVAMLCLLEAQSGMRQLHEAQVREQLSRLEAIKNLAGGVAHDFNNVLAAIGNASFLIRSQAGDNPKVDSALGVIDRSVDKGAATARKLLEFARGGRFESAVIDLPELVEQALAHPDVDLPASIETRVHVAGDGLRIRGDSLQLKNLLIGLIQNALEAMGVSGRLDIYLDAWKADEAASRPGLEAGDYIRCRVVDNGFGMDETLLEHVFEPFFTTKFQGRGLGLAAAYGVMKGHQGFIYLDSAPGQGTTVTLLFPPAGDASE